VSELPPPIYDPERMLGVERGGEWVDGHIWPVIRGARPLAPTPLSAREWLDVLLEDLETQRNAIRRLREYHRGVQPLAYASDAFAQVFGRRFRDACDNWMDLVISATSERMRVVGVRMGGDDAGATNDRAAWDIWQANGLDADSQAAHVDAMVTGVSYVIVGPQDDGSTDPPRLTVEDPGQVVVALSPGDRRRREAALKTYSDRDGQVAWVYLPDEIACFRRKQQGPWLEVADMGGVNPIGVVPVIPIVNRPDARGRGCSDLSNVLPLQDEINKLSIDILVASEFASFRQRVVLGWDPPPDAALMSAASRLWTFNDQGSQKDVRVEEFSATDVRPLILARESAIQRLAARTRTPPHYLLGQSGAFPSGESLKATETGLVAKVNERQRWYSEAWEEALRLALALAGRVPDGAHAAEIVWADPESRSEGELVDALVKLRTIGVPYEDLWERAGYSPQQVERFKKQRGLPDAPPPGATTSTLPPLT
jgi:hypothetical protein